MAQDRHNFYVTTPIYYVNDRPHIGHCYTTLVADACARFRALLGDDVFFLTGTDEHAEKVVSSAKERGLEPQQWADTNASAFRKAFEDLGCSNNDFVRTSEPRHKDMVTAYVRALMDTGDIYLGDYQGWFDPSQEEYVTESVAREHEFKSPVTAKPLEKRSEKNYFFRLSGYTDELLRFIEQHPRCILPEARRNEVLGRIKQGLNDVPISRAVKEGDPQWGIHVPGDDTHRIYVWIDALFNYLSTVDTPDRRRYWPADVHFIAKDILWFHAVIWPCMLMALRKAPGHGWVSPPGTVYTHSFWIREGVKMSKSLGNFVSIDDLRAYAERYSRDAVRYYLITQGPLGVADADFAHAKFVEVYNADLANGIGNSTSRVGNMINKYFDGRVPECDAQTPIADHDWSAITSEIVSRVSASLESHDLLAAFEGANELVRRVDGFINATEPFRLAKKLDEDPGNKPKLSAILYQCAEALRIASLLAWPAMPDKMATLWRTWNCNHLNNPDDPESGFVASLAELARFAHPRHGLRPGQPLTKGDVLFMRADADEPEPTHTRH